MKSTAIYCRVSTKRQDTASQEPDLKRYASAQPEPHEWFSDIFSGRTMERPGWTKLMAAVHRGEICRIVVWRLDRLGRTARGLTALFEELQQRKVNLVSLRDGIDLHTPAGRLMANVLASVSQYETEVRAERVAAGQAVARQKGKTWGGSKKGWKWKVTDDQVRAIIEMRAVGKQIAQIARITTLSRPTVYRVLSAAPPAL